MQEDPDHDGAHSAACPRCGGALDMQDLFTGGRHATVAGCQVCGGHWMRDTDLQRLSEIVEPVVVEWRALPPSAEQLKTLRCPECPGAPTLEKLQSGRDARVLLDHCALCGGVWLDGRELQAIQQDSLFALAAGLTRTLVR
ncbi:MAG TPA: zf-TFIIB domain-containing protein [Aggregicoccus sp.]|nr:zf-TFIIB domain-containing protein [Aggregicoccus sp.]